MPKNGKYQLGDWVVFRKTKFSPAPAARAQGVTPTPHGDDYVYLIDKYWVVVDVDPQGFLRLRTPGGKEHWVPPNSHTLRPATLWERWRFRDRFRSAQSGDRLLPPISSQEIS